jgi:hypothetical protein
MAIPETILPPTTVNKTDTFDQWRQKTNDIIERLNSLYPATNNLEVGGDISFGGTLNITGALNVANIQAVDGNGLNLNNDASGLGIHIDDNGNVGIKTSTPNEALSVFGEMFIDYQSNPANGGAMRFATNANASFLSSNQYYDGSIARSVREGGTSTILMDTTTGSNGGDITFYTGASVAANAISNDTIKLRIKNTGLIQQIAPYGSNSYEIYNTSGNLRYATNIDISGNTLLTMYDQSNNQDVMINTAGNSWLNGGFLGIGTNNPSNPLEVREDGTGTPKILIRSLSNGDPTMSFLSDSKQFTIGIDDTSNAFAISEGSGLGSSDRLVIDSSGNVGIGTSSPQTQLQVHNPANASAYSKFTNVNTGATVTDGTTVGISTAGDFQIWNWESSEVQIATNNVQRLTIDSSGNVGIGTSDPDRPLHVEVTATNTAARFGASSGGDAIGFTPLSAGNGTLIGSTNDAESDFEPLGLRGEFVYFETGTSSVTERLRIGDVRTRSTYNGNYIDQQDGQIAFTNNASPVGNQDIGKISFSADRNGAAVTTYAKIASEAEVQGSGTYSGNIKFFTVDSPSSALSERMRISPDGNVGIGTSSPAAPLHVVDNTAVYPQTLASFGNSDENSPLRIVSASNTQWGLQSYNSRDIIFENRVGSGTPSRLMTIKNDGKVGIGTSSPNHIVHIKETANSTTTANLILDSIVQYGYEAGTFEVRRQDYYVSSFGGVWEDNDNSYARIGIRHSGSTVYPLTIRDNMIGIGTSSPSSTLHVQKDQATATAIRVQNGTANSAAQAALYVNANGNNFSLINYPDADATNANITRFTSTASGSKFILAPDSTDTLTVDDGKVGIGTNSPSHKLDVVGDIQVEDFIRNSLGESMLGFLQGSSDDHGLTIGSSGESAGNKYDRILFSLNNAERMRIDSSGNVGIGTSSPGAVLNIAIPDGANIGTLYTSKRSYNDSANRVDLIYQYEYNSSGGITAGSRISFAKEGFTDGHYGSDIRFLTRENGIATTEKMRIQGNGKVGIGTSSPNDKLHVSGGIRTSGAWSGQLSSSGVMDYTGNTTRLVSMGNATTRGQFQFYIQESDGGNQITPMLIYSTGAIAFGNGHTATELISVDGNIAFEDATYAKQGLIGTVHTGSGSHDMIFSTRQGGTEAEKFRILSDGSFRFGQSGVLTPVLKSDDSMHFRIDADSSTSGNEFTWQHDGGTVLVRLADTGYMRFVTSGAAATPVITVGNTTDTGMWTSGANHLNFSAGGNELLRMQSGNSIQTYLGIKPVGTTGTLDLGSNSERWADIHTNAITLNGEQKTSWGDVSSDSLSGYINGSNMIEKGFLTYTGDVTNKVLADITLPNAASNNGKYYEIIWNVTSMNSTDGVIRRDKASSLVQSNGSNWIHAFTQIIVAHSSGTWFGGLPAIIGIDATSVQLIHAVTSNTKSYSTHFSLEVIEDVDNDGAGVTITISS